MCVENGIVADHTQMIDSAVIKANTSMDSLEIKVPEEELKSHLQKARYLSRIEKQRRIKPPKTLQIITASNQELQQEKSSNRKWEQNQDRRGTSNKGAKYTSNKTN